MTEFDKVIPPGGVGKVTASFDTTHYRGPVAKGIRITTDDPASGTVNLQLQGNVVPVIEVLPTERPLVEGTIEKSTPTKLTISASDGRTFAILGVTDDPKIQVTVRPAPDDATQPAAETNGTARPPTSAARRAEHAATPPTNALADGHSRYLVTIAAKPGTPPGQSFVNLAITTDHPKAQHVLVHPIIRIAPAVEVVPNRLVLHGLPDPIVMHAKIRKPDGDALKILGVESSDGELVASTTPVVEGREYDLAVRYTGKRGRGRVRANITIRTDAPGHDTLVVPVQGRI